MNKTGDEVAFYEWTGDGYAIHRAIVRALSSPHGPATLLYGTDQSASGVLNVEQFGTAGPGRGDSYWKASRAGGVVAVTDPKTDVPIVGESVWYRPRKGAESANLSAIVLAVGRGEHPDVDLMFVTDGGDRGKVAAVPAVESAADSSHWATRVRRRGDMQ